MSKALYKEGDVVMIINAPKRFEMFDYTIFKVTEFSEKENTIVYKIPWMKEDEEGIFKGMYLEERYIDLFMSKDAANEYEDAEDNVDILMLDDGFVFDETMKVWEPS